VKGAVWIVDHTGCNFDVLVWSTFFELCGLRFSSIWRGTIFHILPHPYSYQNHVGQAAALGNSYMAHLHNINQAVEVEYRHQGKLDHNQAPLVQKLVSAQAME